MNFTSKIKFKQQFKSLNFYSMPNSILFAVRKRLNFIFFWVIIVTALTMSII